MLAAEDGESMIAVPKQDLQEVPEPRPKYYVLSGQKAVPCSMAEWASRFELVCHVGDTTIGGVRVSTVFLGIDHNWSVDGPPLIFETMVFGGDFDRDQDRYSTWEEAKQGHAVAVDLVRWSQTFIGRMILLRRSLKRLISSIVDGIRDDAARLWRWIRSCWR